MSREDDLLRYLQLRRLEANAHMASASGHAL